jgi:hypothetical protein
MPEKYEGRLASVGDGNLMADEGPRAGEQVAYDEGQFIFVEPGEPSHFDRHHKQFAEFTGTVDESMTDDPDLVNASPDENPHHFSSDPPVGQDDDRVSPYLSSHTEAYKA